MNTLNVYYEDKLVGKLTQTMSNKVVFQYSKEWLNNGFSFAVSLCLPKQEAAFSEELSSNFFDNLLPEETIRKALAKSLNIYEDNIFGLLDALGSECAGALTVCKKQNLTSQTNYKKINRKEFFKILEDLPTLESIEINETNRFSLAGAQSKVALLLQNEEYYIPNGSPSNVIIKSKSNQAFDYLAENELFCMLLAKIIGLDIPDVSVTETMPRNFIIKRYDRITEGDKVKRIHQEDFCQALGISKSAKYGVTLKQCFNLLDNCRNPEEDKIKLFQIILYNYCIGNYDAHAKNFSLLYDKGNKPRLAPFYDLLCIDCYGFPKELAMKIGRKKNPNFVFISDWLELAKLANIASEKVIEGIYDFCEILSFASKDLYAEFTNKYGNIVIIDKIMATIEHNVSHLSSMIEPNIATNSSDFIM